MPAWQRCSAVSTAPCAAPMRVLCESATYLSPFRSAGSARSRPTLVAMPPGVAVEPRLRAEGVVVHEDRVRRGARQPEAGVVAAEGTHRVGRGRGIARPLGLDH